MAGNGYQGQLRAEDQTNGYFAANQEIMDLISADCAVAVSFLQRLGIQTPAGTRIKVNNKEIEVGKTNIYELSNVEITSLKFVNNSSAYTVINYIIA